MTVEVWRTPEDAAAALKVSKRRVLEWARLGTIPSHKFGRSVRFSPGDWAAIEAGHKRDPAATTPSSGAASWGRSPRRRAGA